MKEPMQLFGISTKLIKLGDDLVDVIFEALSNQRLEIEGKDLLAIASKAVAIAQKRIVKLSSIEQSEKAKTLA